MDRVSVLIASYRNVDLLRRCIDTLAACCRDCLPEIVVVDDAAGDPTTAEFIESRAELGIKFAVMPANGGFAGANNFGYKFCTREFVVLVNSDIEFNDNPFPALVDFMDTHPEAGIAQGTLVIRNEDKYIDGTLNGCGAFLTGLGTMVTPEWLKPADDSAARLPRRCFAVCGAFLMLRRSVVQSTGRLFYDFFHSYYEETDLCHRAWLAGWEVWYVPTPVVYHCSGATTWKSISKEVILRRFYRNMRFSFRTCLGFRGFFTILPVFELCCLAQSIVQLLKGKGLAWRAHRWARREIRGMKAEIREARRFIQGHRVMNDTALFKVILRRYDWRQLMSLARQNA